MIQSDFQLILSDEAILNLKELQEDNSKRAVEKAVFKALKFMCFNLKHPSLNTHKFDDFEGPNGEEVFESYAQNHTPGAY